MIDNVNRENSELLNKARLFEEKNEKAVENQKPKFHLATRVGWMNDPNGFCFYNGEYHMFYQYYPYESKWGPMHWGHAVSKDLLTWRYLPVALAPDKSYDVDGCFSGSAIELEDGRHLLLYTGVDRSSIVDGVKSNAQVQCIAIGDGIDYEKYEGNPVISSDMIPEGSYKRDFRDPKIWKSEEGIYYCVIANRADDEDGQILLYSSTDGIEWRYESILLKNRNRYGTMWECPDFFELDGNHILIVSPMDMLPQGHEFIGGNGTICFIGQLDESTKQLQETTQHSIDYGIDFYAPQTTMSADGRRIMIGWMQNWDTYQLQFGEVDWIGQMTIPRELSVKDGRLIQYPIRELEEYRVNKIQHEAVKLDNADHIKLEGISGRIIDLEMVIKPWDCESGYEKFSMYFAQDEKSYTEFSYLPSENLVSVDRTHSGSRRAILHERKCEIKPSQHELRVRMILDKYSAEIFINQGEHAITTLVLTEEAADQISFSCDGKVELSVVKYDLERDSVKK